MFIHILPHETRAGDTLPDGRQIVCRMPDSRVGNPVAIILDWDGGHSTLEWCSRMTRIDVRRVDVHTCCDVAIVDRCQC